MKKYVFWSALLFLMTTSAAAEIKGCYERKYDAGVLKRNPKQLVTYLFLQYGMQPNDQEDDEDFIELRLRGSKSILINNYSCKATNKKLVCKIEDYSNGGKNGGAFEIAQTKNGLVIRPITNLVLVDSTSEKPYVFQITGVPGHKEFTLKKTAASICEVK